MGGVHFVMNIDYGRFGGYTQTPTMEHTDRESSEECPRHRTFQPKLLMFSGGGPHPFDQGVSLSGEAGNSNALGTVV